MKLIIGCNESKFCDLLDEAVWELSPDFCRQMLRTGSLKPEVISSFYNTALSWEALRQRADNGFSTYEMLEVLKQFGGDPNFEHCHGVRMLFFELIDATKVLFEHALQAVEFFLTRTKITSADLSYTINSEDDSCLLFEEELDVDLSRNVRRVFTVLLDRLEDLETCLSTLEVSTRGGIRFDGKASLPESLIFLIASFTMVRPGLHELASWNVEPLKFDYDGHVMMRAPEI